MALIKIYTPMPTYICTRSVLYAFGLKNPKWIKNDPSNHPTRHPFSLKTMPCPIRSEKPLKMFKKYVFPSWDQTLSKMPKQCFLAFYTVVSVIAANQYLINRMAHIQSLYRQSTISIVCNIGAILWQGPMRLSLIAIGDPTHYQFTTSAPICQRDNSEIIYHRSNCAMRHICQIR